MMLEELLMKKNPLVDLLMTRDGRSWPLSISLADHEQKKTSHGCRLLL
jgi:hypothetical protein